MAGSCPSASRMCSALHHSAVMGTSAAALTASERCSVAPNARGFLAPCAWPLSVSEAEARPEMTE